MKKMLMVLLSLLLALSAVSAASAEVITGMAVEPFTGRTANYARIRVADAEKALLSVELIVPEVFRQDDVEALKPGDSIYTGGEEVLIQSVDHEGDYVILNKGEYEFSDGSVWLEQHYTDGNYQVRVMDDYVWMVLEQMETPVPEHLVFLDWIDPSTGDILDLPSVHSGADFWAMLQDPEGPGFDVNNVMAAFDEQGALALVWRFYTPWQ